MDRFTVANIAAAANPILDAFDYNGAIGTVSVVNPLSYIPDARKWVLSGAGNLSLDRTISHIIDYYKIAANTRGVAVNDGEILATIPIIGNYVAMYNLIALCHAAGLDFNYRNSDLISDADWAADIANVHASVLDIPSRILAFMRDNPAAAAAAAPNAHLIPLIGIANAIHRSHTEGHNWYTDDTRRRNTAASRAVAVAGKHKRTMIDVMVEYGHDMFHMFTNDSLDAYCDAVTGLNRALIANAYMFEGVDRAGQTLDAVLKVGEAACDRWPVGILGKSAVIIGFDCLRIMIESISHKVVLANKRVLIDGINALQAEMDEEKFVRADLIGIKNRMGASISMAYGYATGDATIAERYENNPSIINFSKNYMGQVAIGTALYKSVKEIKLDDAMVATAIANAIETIAASL